MTIRDEEILNASTVYHEEQFHCDGWNYDFIEGAKWADQHPSVCTVKKIICYALKRTNIMLAEDLENGVEWELLIKKAMEE